MSDHWFYSTLLMCAHCNGMGAITWDLKYREAAKKTSFVRLCGDFQTRAGHLDEEVPTIVCTQCDAVHGPLPADSGV